MTDTDDGSNQDVVERHRDVGSTDGAENRNELAADELYSVALAIEDVDYNRLHEGDLLVLLTAWQAIHEMALKYRRNQWANGP